MKITLDLDSLTADALARVDRAIRPGAKWTDVDDSRSPRTASRYRAQTARRLFTEALFCLLDAIEDDAAHPRASRQVDPGAALRFALAGDRRRPCRSFEHAQADEAAVRALESAGVAPDDAPHTRRTGSGVQLDQAAHTTTETITINGASIEVPRALLDAARRRAADAGHSLEDLLARIIARDNPPQ